MKPRKVRVRLAIAGLGLPLALGITTHAPAASQASPSPVESPVIYQKSRSFRVPFHFAPEERARRRELQLWVSADQGRNWNQRGVTTPDRPTFTLSTDHDGEYWLAVRSVDSQGRLFPGDEARIEPSMRVVVDTTPPAIVLEPKVRSASLASVRWEVRDHNSDASHPPTLQYQVAGSKEWQPVSLDEEGLIGVATWDAGVTGPLKVRATTTDRAGNKAETIIDLASSKPGSAPVASTEPPPTAAPAAQPEVASAPDASGDSASSPIPLPRRYEVGPRPVAPAGGESPEQAVAQVQTVPPPDGGHAQGRIPAAVAYASAQDVGAYVQAPAPAPVALEQPPIVALPVGAGGATAPLPPQPMRGSPRSASPESEPATEFANNDRQGAEVAGEPGPVLGVPRTGIQDQDVPQPKLADQQTVPEVEADPGVGMAALSEPAEPANSPESPPPGQIAKLKVPGQRFLLDYAVDRAGPDGRPAVVELWVTRDGGKTWTKGGADPDRTSPILVELSGEGTFGISLIAQDANGLGDKPPAPGDEPKLWVEVEAAPQRAAQAPNLLQRVIRR